MHQLNSSLRTKFSSPLFIWRCISYSCSQKSHKKKILFFLFFVFIFPIIKKHEGLLSYGNFANVLSVLQKHILKRILLSRRKNNVHWKGKEKKLHALFFFPAAFNFSTSQLRLLFLIKAVMEEQSLHSNAITFNHI